MNAFDETIGPLTAGPRAQPMKDVGGDQIVATVERLLRFAK
jgi:hypothetical protein